MFENRDDEDFTPKLAVIGVGGQGSNLVNRIYNQGIKSAATIAINTDAKHLNMINSSKKLLIGKNVTSGLGAGGYPEIAQKCAEASRADIERAVQGYNMVFVCAGMGGGTGSGAAPVVAEVARENGALVVAFTTYPFALERNRKVKADLALKELTKKADTTIVIENDRLLSYAPNLQMEKAFELIDNIAADAVRGISDTLLLPSLINLDFADIRSVMRDAGTAVINIGTGYGPDRVEKAIKSTVTHPLMDVDFEGAKSALVHVAGSDSLSIEEATKVGEGVTQGLADNANVIFGARLMPELNNQIKVMSIVTGVKPKFFEYVSQNYNSRAADLELENLY
ncbi:MAG: cell division protein FtsZ [Candidatus Micrarchaeota archaeon]|nr:cell division protein FtsZ [Candidatus Micrarchaeota archaeon]